LGRHLSENLTQRFVSTPSDVFIDAFRIDDTAVAQGDALLLGVEWNILVERHRALGLGHLIDQPRNDAALDQRLFDDLCHIGGLHLAIEEPIGVDDHHGPHGAKASATRFNYAHLVLQAPTLDLGSQGSQCLS